MQQRHWDKRNRDPYYLRWLLNQSVSLAGPLLSLHWLWLCVAMTAAPAACSSRSPVWTGGTEAHGFRADCPVAPPQVTDLISGSLCPVKASTELSKPAKPSAAQAEQPATGWGCRRERPRWPSGNLKRPLPPPLVRV